MAFISSLCGPLSHRADRRLCPILVYPAGSESFCVASQEGSNQTIECSGDESRKRVDATQRGKVGVSLYTDLLLGICLIALAITVALWLLLARRYGRRPATLALTALALCSFVIAGVPTGILATQLEKTISDPSPSANWHKVKSLDEMPTGLEYRTGDGLFATTHSGEEKIAEAPPACLLDDLIAQANSTTHPSPPAEVTTNPHLDLSPPPGQPAYQVTLNILYPVGTDEYGSVGFAVYNDGEVWCTEKYGRGGLAGGTAFGVAVYGALFFSIILFTAIFIVTAILASIITIVVLEVRHRHMASKLRDEIS